ncbi:MAG: hypothetical protein H7144_05325 [Burkholderiales bacterium]|nr:hypothetical protein [Phycisphaerae bacterium]
MKPVLLILIILNVFLVALALLAVSGVVPQLASWPHDLIIRNRSGHQIKVTLICVHPDGSPRSAKLYPDRTASRMLSPVGGLAIPEGADATFVYDREYAEPAALIIEDERGRAVEMPAPETAPNQPLTFSIDSLESLAIVTPTYRSVLNESKRPPRPTGWYLLPCLTLVVLVATYWRTTRNSRASRENHSHSVGAS